MKYTVEQVEEGRVKITFENGEVWYSDTEECPLEPGEYVDDDNELHDWLAHDLSFR